MSSMDGNFDREKERLFGKLSSPAASEKSRVVPRPVFLFYGRVEQQSGASKKKMIVDALSSRRVGAKRAANTEAQVAAGPSKKRVTVPSDNQVAPCVPKMTPASNKIVKLEPDSDKRTIPTYISDSKSKKRVYCPAPPTFVLLASGKVETGITDEHNRQIDEIDLPDVNNQLAVVEYVEDLYTFYKQQQHVRRPIDYMSNQLYINNKMRALVVSWIIEVHDLFALWPETLYLSIYIMDRYLSMDVVLRRQLQLVGISTLLIASKYEENCALQVSDLIQISGYAYTKEEITRMEKLILNKLDWYLTVPTAYMFLVRYIKAAKADKELEHMIYFFGELGLVEYTLIKYCPSMVAASAVYAARCTLKMSPLWTETLKRHTSYSEPELLDCAQLLVNAHSAALLSKSKSKLKVVYNKYKEQQFEGVACYPPATSLIEERKSAACASS